MFAASLPGHRIPVNDRGSVTCLASWSMRCALVDSKCLARRQSFAFSAASQDSEGLANKDGAFSDVEYASASASGLWVPSLGCRSHLGCGQSPIDCPGLRQSA